MPESGESDRVRSLSMGADFLRRLENLSIAAGRLIAQGGISTRAGAVRGGRTEFLEHKGYVEGDDLRDLDWNVLARTDEPFVKVFGAEREKRVTILLDLSPSMAAVAGKDIFACRLAASLAHVALASGDTVSLGLAGGQAASVKNWKGVQATRELILMLERVGITKGVDWEKAIRNLSSVPRAPGAAIIISDFWGENIVDALAPLVQMRQEITLLHVLTPEEISPRETGNFLLEDSESGESLPIHISERDLDAYRAEVENHIESTAEAARKRRMRHILCRTDIAFERLVLTYLRQGGLLK